MPDGCELIPDEVRTLLSSGEEPRVYELVTFLNAPNRSGASGKPRLVEGFSWDPLSGGVTSDPDWSDAALSGVAAEGERGSLADLFVQAVGAGAQVLVTDRHLLVVDSSDNPPQVRFACRSQEVRSARRAPRLLQRGRVELTFADDSIARPMLGMFFTGAARRLVAAVGQE